MKLQSLQNEKISMEDAFFSPTAHSALKNINRDGLFFSVFNKMFDPDFKSVPHILCSRFDAFKAENIFYQFKGQSFSDEKNGLALFHLNPNECSVEMLSDVLDWMKTFSVKWEAYYHFEVNAADTNHQLYLTRFFHLLSSKLEYVPKARSATDIQKASSFEGSVVIEAGTQWKCLDNQLLHAVLSKGAAYIQPEAAGDFKVQDELELSPFHRLQIVERSSQKAQVKYPVALEEKLSALNYFQNPQDMKIFYHLIYRNIFTGN